MTARTQTSLTLVVFLWMTLALMQAAWAEPVCFQLEPFVDRLTVEFTRQVNCQVDWDGLTVYHLDGCGVAARIGSGAAGQLAVFSIVFNNTSDVFFNGLRLAKFHAVRNAVVGESVWEAEFSLNLEDPEQPPLHFTGTLARVPCEPIGADPAIAGTPRLMGEEHQQATK